MSRPRDDDLPAPDARFDAAWRAVSREEPPAALDAAIRAAARREVGAGPQRSSSDLPEATHPARWWFPLAAAATVGAMALGLLQIVGQDKLFSGDASTVVSDLPPGTALPTREAPVSAPPAPPEAKSARRPVAPMRPHSVATVAGEPPAPGQAATDRIDLAPPANQRQPAIEATGSMAPAFPAASSAPDLPAFAAASPATAEAVAPRTVPIATPRSLEGASVPTGAAKLAGSPVERRQAGAVHDASDASTPLPVAEWIALIRRLRDQGEVDEALKALAAFRNAHPDHERLLPPDLVRWRPEAK